MRTALTSCLTAAALALAACGGGSTTNTTNSSHATASTDARTATAPAPPGGAPAGSAPGTATPTRTVTARHGGFRTVLPTGFTVKASQEAAVELWALRRTPARHDLQATVDLALTRLAHTPTFLPRPRDVSSPQPTQVDGQPALYIDDRVGGPKPSERRQLFVEDGGFAYEISDSASPVEFPASLAALDELLRHWRWQ